jgi:hypothetical protein
MIQEEGLQKPKLGDVSPRFESGVLSFNFIVIEVVLHLELESHVLVLLQHFIGF